MLEKEVVYARLHGPTRAWCRSPCVALNVVDNLQSAVFCCLHDHIMLRNMCAEAPRLSLVSLVPSSLLLNLTQVQTFIPPRRREHSIEALTEKRCFANAQPSVLTFPSG